MFLQRFTGSLSCSSKDSLDPCHVPPKIHWITVMFLQRFTGSLSCSSRDSLDRCHVPPEIHWIAVMFLQRFAESLSRSSKDSLDHCHVPPEVHWITMSSVPCWCHDEARSPHGCRWRKTWNRDRHSTLDEPVCIGRHNAVWIHSTQGVWVVVGVGCLQT